MSKIELYTANVITLTLLHPLDSTVIQSWTFADHSLIRIGRATDNEVVLYSAVVSRRYLELRAVSENWEIVNLGSNGTYLDGKRVSQVPVGDGVIIRLAHSGPQLQIRLGISLEQGTKTTSQNQHPTMPVKDSSKETVIGGFEGNKY